MSKPSAQIASTLQKAAISGGVAAFGINILTDKASSQFIYAGRAIPVWQIAMAMGAASSVAVSVVSKTILPHIPNNKKSQHFESLTLHLAASGGLFYVIPYMMNNALTMSEGSKFIVAGAVSEMIATYVNDYMMAFESATIGDFEF